MNPVTNGILIISGVSLTLAVIYLRLWLNRRERWDFLALASGCLSLSIFACFERALMQIDDPVLWGEVAKWAHIPGGAVILSIAWFVTVHLHAGRRWLFWCILGLRAISLPLNFMLTPNLNFREISSIGHLNILGEPISYAIGTPNPLTLLNHIGIGLVVILGLDASVKVWRQGNRHQALVIGGGIVAFAAAVMTIVVMAVWSPSGFPFLASFAFFFIVAAMAYELNYEMNLSGRLAAELRIREAELNEKAEQLQLSANAASVGVWSRKVGEKEIHASRKWNEMFGFDPDKTVLLDEFRSRVHPDDLALVLGNTNQMEEAGNDFDYEFRIVLPSGEVRWVTSFGNVEFVDGRPSILRGASVDITERKLAEEANKELADIVESTDDAIFRKSLDGVITTWNAGAEKTYGYAAADVIGQNVAILAPDDLKSQAAEILEKIRRGETVAHLETVRVTKNGQRIYVSLSVSPIRDHTGKIVAASTIARNITKRKLAAEAARKSEERNRDLVRALPDIIFVQASDGTYLDCQASDPKDLLMPPESFIGKNMTDVLPPELAAKFRRHFDLAMETSETQILEYQLPISGEDRWFEARVVRTKEDKLLSVVRDITARVIAEADLRDRQAELAGLIGSALDAIIFIDDNQNVVLFNTGAEKMLKCSADEAIGKSLGRFVPEKYRAVYGEAIREFGATGEMKRLPTPLIGRRATGEDFPLEASFSRVEIKGRNFYTVIVRDISNRLEAEQLVREKEYLLTESQRIAHVGSWSWDLADDLKWSDETYRLYGVTPDKFTLSNESFLERIHPEDRPAMQQWIEECMAGNSPEHLEFRVPLPDGSVRILSGRGDLVYDAENRPVLMSGTVQDVTDQKKAEEALSDLSGRLINAQETERSRLARELHDDLSQSLALLSIQLQSLAIDPEDPDQIQQQISNFTSQIRKLSTDIHRISHELHPAKLEQLGLESALSGFCRETGESLKLKIDLHAIDVPRHLPSDISLCLYRVAQEALQNVGKHGNASIVSVNLEKRDSELCLIVTDNGIGFDPAAVKFKESLGLVSMRERVRSVNGTLKIDSSPGNGTQITATVPIAD